jgi:competence protein ComEC
MTVVYLAGRLLWKKVNLLNTISFSAFLLLLVNPFSLFDIGFELTFAATLAIILFYPRIVRLLPRLPGRVHELFALSLSAQLGVLPLIASTFHRVTFSSLLLNIPAIPLVGVIMGGGFLFLGLSLVSAAAAQPAAQALAFLVRVFLWISGLLNPIPALSYRLPGPHLATIIGYFLFLLLLLVRPRFKGQRLAALGLFAGFMAVLVTYPFPAASSPSLKITFLDVGQGDSMLVEFPGRKKMVVDGGGTPDGNFDIGEQVVSPFLWEKGIKKIDYLVLTHGHPDHMNGLVSLAANFKVGEFWEAFSPPENGAYRKLKANLSAAAATRRVFSGYSHRESGVVIEAVHPESGEPLAREVSNEDSLVLRLTSDGASFLLAADVGTKAEAEIIDKGRDIQSRVLKSPHHGSRTSSSVPFLEQVRPQVVVITTGRGNPYGVPHQDILERYRAAGARVLRTDETGAVEIIAEGSALRLRTANHAGDTDLIRGPT